MLTVIYKDHDQWKYFMPGHPEPATLKDQNISQEEWQIRRVQFAFLLIRQDFPDAQVKNVDVQEDLPDRNCEAVTWQELTVLDFIPRPKVQDFIPPWRGVI